MVGRQRSIVTASTLKREKKDDRPITITTWQSIYKLERKWFEKYNVVIGDERIYLSQSPWFRS